MKKTIHNKKQNKNTAFWRKLRTVKWYIWPLFSTLILTACFILFKIGIKDYDRFLFKSAEQEMLSLNLPKSEKTTYVKDCSYKSSESVWQGFPNCNLQRLDTYHLENINDESDLILNVEERLNQSGLSTSSNFTDKGNLEEKLSNKVRGDPRLTIHNLKNNLKCYVYIVNKGVQPVEDLKLQLNIAINCYKRVIFQLYPESSD